MKKIHFSLLMLAIVVICTSCKREPLAMVFITNSITVPITLYGEKDTSPSVRQGGRRSQCESSSLHG